MLQLDFSQGASTSTAAAPDGVSSTVPTAKLTPYATDGTLLFANS